MLTIDLEIDHVDTAVVRDRSVLISKDRNADHQWIDCDNGNAPIPGETWLTYTARSNGHYAVIVIEWRLCGYIWRIRNPSDRNKRVR